MPKTAIVGIRREDKSRWERRVPITPREVEALGLSGLRFLIQPSAIRTYDDRTYSEAGALLAEDLAPAKVVFAVKEIPPEKLLPERTYVYFAHVIKGQRHNMPMLADVLAKKITLIDYERISDRTGQRLVKFGREAGKAGMIDTLFTLGRRLAQEGHTSPLAELRQAFAYRDLAEVKTELARIGELIKRSNGNGIAEPLIVGFTGRGSVSSGAQRIFDQLPHELVEPEQLAEVVLRPERDRLFKVVFDKWHLAVPKSGGEFNEEEYHRHPERYEPRLPEYLPYLTVLVNGIFWTPEFPRLVEKTAIAELWQRGERRLRVIGDISCDIDGAIELTCKSTQPDNPTFVYDPETGATRDGFDGLGIAVMAVDNLPCELPRDASDQFSAALREFVPAIVRADYKRSFKSLALPPEVKKAVICHQGALTPDYRYLEEFLPR
jgi:alanine dehydrogenase